MPFFVMLLDDIVMKEVKGQTISRDAGAGAGAGCTWKLDEFIVFFEPNLSIQSRV